MNSKDSSATRGNVGIIIYNAKSTDTTDTTNTDTTDTTTTTSNNGSCAIFPSDHPINQKITDLPVHPLSQQIVDKITARRNSLHPDFGADRDGGPFGIPFVYVNAQTSKIATIATDYADESDEGNFPIPLNAPIEK